MMWDPYDASMSNAQNVSAAWKDAFEAGKTGGQEHPGDGGSVVRSSVSKIFGMISKLKDWLLWLMCGDECGYMDGIIIYIIIITFGPQLILSLIKLIIPFVSPIIVKFIKLILYTIPLKIIEYIKLILYTTQKSLSSSVKAYIDDDEK
jgi:hypothetical protein